MEECLKHELIIADALSIGEMLVSDKSALYVL